MLSVIQTDTANVPVAVAAPYTSTGCFFSTGLSGVPDSASASESENAMLSVDHPTPPNAAPCKSSQDSGTRTSSLESTARYCAKDPPVSPGL